ncbi:MAG: hypothetical protein ACE5GH_06535 [Fidelibacterota bacterium]
MGRTITPFPFSGKFLLVLLLLLTARPVDARTPPCGAILRTPGETIRFDSDLVCPPDFQGDVLTIWADRVAVDGEGFRIFAPEAGRGVVVQGGDSVTVKNLGIVVRAIGIDLILTSFSEVANVHVSVGDTGTTAGFNLDLTRNSTI